MIIAKEHHRARIVKGWAFMALPNEENKAIRKFLVTGNTDDLPDRFKHSDYSIYTTRH